MDTAFPASCDLLQLTTCSDRIPSSANVYIVDDDSMVRRSLSFSLSTTAYSTRTFASGRDFLDDVDKLSPGCVLLDIRMPEIDGLAVLSELGIRINRFAVVAMTGHGDIETAVQAMKSGAKDFLEKPFTDAILIETLTTLFESLPVNVEIACRRKDAIARVGRLTTREREVLQGLIVGWSNKALAMNLGISIRTVEMHRANLMGRMGAKSISEIIHLADLAEVIA
ncbi:response regulator transcription factor [Sphingomonas sp. GB1N7]|uniref:response regulator transcription factor n=1 Tax=Parasphingomonas caseinilytica TaxID=3096158 RepID=UPI002FCA301A